ncbi:hypothetical protein CSUI_009606 [Cystoisospora suis]|uniref:Uncharacterized protein n=1 Tax=Cystoisospora suis TaxID=483139 RepID=A0A2C6KIV9_9APIC|nr:hypothetical protein CSUI_009606 [Cystoisospora suis]
MRCIRRSLRIVLSAYSFVLKISGRPEESLPVCEQNVFKRTLAPLADPCQEGWLEDERTMYRPHIKLFHRNWWVHRRRPRAMTSTVRTSCIDLGGLVPRRFLLEPHQGRRQSCPYKCCAIIHTLFLSLEVLSGILCPLAELTSSLLLFMSTPKRRSLTCYVVGQISNIPVPLSRSSGSSR